MLLRSPWPWGLSPWPRPIVAAVAVGVVEGISELQPQENASQFRGDRSIGEFKQWDFRATLFTNFESLGETEYVHSLVVSHSTMEGIAVIVPSEVNPDATAVRFGSHRLTLFSGEEPKLIATGDEWVEIDEFRERSLKLGAKELELTGTWNPTSFTATVDASV